ncbi:hypothetical protein RHGRI_007199 [Rhododendron griersonianum]|uniref:Uncharacterized protein n=1 Tax=Rhododendron griersonianum TaxID=479676 RepID=A0AAV6KXH3_9ERIC|nr:hypothetical protein RHGRI_007199 [Rhododendron griersonianum]
MTEIRDSNLHLADSMGSLTTNANAMFATMGDLVSMMKEERKGKGLADLPPQTPVMLHFGVFNGFPGRQPPGGYMSPQPLGFQASNFGGGPAHGGMHPQAQDQTGQNPPRPVENLERYFMLGGNSTPQPPFGNQGGGPPPMGGHHPHVAANTGFMQQDARGAWQGLANSEAHL